MIELKKVSKTYKSKKSTDTNALQDITTKFGNKGLVFIVGASGSGKSTLLNCIGGLDKIDEGSIIVNGIDISKKKELELDQYRNTYVGFVFQDFNLIEDLNVKENIKLACELQNKKISDTEFEDLLKKVNLGGLGNRRVNELSGGQKQRVAIARALVKNPHVILADEPTGNLDSKTSKQIIELLKDLSQERLVIIVSHDTQMSLEYGNRIIEIEDGKIIKDTKEEREDKTNPTKFEKSHLPINVSFKLAIANLINNKVRLSLTIILTCFSLLFILITLNIYNYDKTNQKDLITQMILDNKEYNLDVLKHKCQLKNYYQCDLELMNEEDITTIKNNVPIAGNTIYQLSNNGEYINFKFNIGEELSPEFKNDYYTTNRDLLFVELNESTKIDEIMGNLPTKENEIAISKWLAEKIIKYGVETINNSFYQPKSFDQILKDQTEIKLGNNSIIIVGIILENDQMYESVKDESIIFNEDISNFKIDSDFKVYEGEFVQPVFIYSKGLKDYLELSNDSSLIINNITLDSSLISIYGDNLLLNDEITYLDNTGIKTTDHLEKDEVILSMSSLESAIPNFSNNFIEYQKSNPTLTYEEAINEFLLINVKDVKVEKVDGHTSFLLKNKNDHIVLKVKGYSFDDFNYFSKNIIDEYEHPEKNMIGVRYYVNNKKDITSVLNTYGQFDISDNIPGIKINSFYRYSSYNLNVDTLHNTIKGYTFWVMGIFIIFGIILIYNFLKNTIDNNKKMIGILRALGTKNNDILSIYAIEAIVLIIASWIFSCIAFYFTNMILNNYLLTEVFYKTRWIIINPKTIINVLEYSIIISICIIIITTSRLSRIKPIDAINNRK